MPTNVKVSKCDNELYILAFQWGGSSELVHIKSGNNDPVNVSFNLESILPKGKWQLTLVGVNWGGPWNFEVTVGSKSYAKSGQNDLGVVWSEVTDPVTI